MGSYYFFFEDFLQQNYAYKFKEFIKNSYCRFCAIKTPPPFYPCICLRTNFVRNLYSTTSSGGFIVAKGYN